jgi:hypothetical protein
MNHRSERSSAIHQARVYLAQARVRRHQHAFHARLLCWAASQRMRAASAKGLF